MIRLNSFVFNLLVELVPTLTTISNQVFQNKMYWRSTSRIQKERYDLQTQPFAATSIQQTTPFQPFQRYKYQLP